MENLLIGALIFLAGLFTQSFLPSYMKKKGENLATKEDIRDLAHQTALLTQTAKEIEAKISDASWDRQKRWELKRDQVFLMAVKMVALKSALANLHSVYSTEAEAKGRGLTGINEQLVEVGAACGLAADEFESAMITASIVCSKKLFDTARDFAVFARDLAIEIADADVKGSEEKRASDLANWYVAMTKALQNELSINTSATPRSNVS
jgi:hypothetical protein